MKTVFVLLLLLSVVALSGCIGGGGGATSSSNGIIISSFIADPNEVEGQEAVYFMADIKNVGGAKATAVKGELIGLPNAWSLRQISGSECNVLYPPEPNLEGDVCTFEWEAVAPSSDTTISYPVDFKASYNYATKYEALLRVASRDWIKSLPKEEQEAEKKKLGVSYSGDQTGPIHVTVKLRTPEIYAGRDTYVVLDIQNVGSGRPKDDMVNIKVSGVICKNTGNIKLSQGRSKQIRCVMPTSGIQHWINIRIDVDLNYDYWVKTSTEVQVLSAPIM